MCSDSTSGNYSKADTFTTPGITPVEYCATNGNSTYEYINKVVFGSIKNTSGNNNGYYDYTSLTATLNTGGSETIKLVPGFTGASYKEHWTVYIDYDKNKIFDANEEVTHGNGTGAVIRTFTIPDTVKSGYTRMRIIMHYNGARKITCGTFTDGEVEDYRIHIINSSTCNIETAGINTASTPGILVIPDPTEGSNIKVMLQLAQVAPVTLRITDISGRTLADKRLQSVLRGKNVYSINGLHLTPGTYIIFAEQGNSIITRTKFVVVQ